MTPELRLEQEQTGCLLITAIVTNLLFVQAAVAITTQTRLEAVAKNLTGGFPQGLQWFRVS